MYIYIFIWITGDLFGIYDIYGDWLGLIGWSVFRFILDRLFQLHLLFNWANYDILLACTHGSRQFEDDSLLHSPWFQGLVTT